MGTVTEMLNVGLDPRAMDRELGLGHSAIVWAQSGVDARHLNTTGWRALRSIFHNPDDWRSVFGVTRLVDLVQNGQAISDWGYDLATLEHYGYLETDKLLAATDWVLRPPAGITAQALDELRAILLVRP